MEIDIVTLCASASASGNKLSISEAYNLIYVPALPHVHPPSTVAIRIKLDEFEHGDHVINLAVADLDGRILTENVFPFYLDPVSLPPPTNPVPHPVASLCMIFSLPRMEFQLFGEYSIDLTVSGGTKARTAFYVYPASAEQSS